MARGTSSKPPSGMRDFLPVEIRRRRHVSRIIEEVYESYGFEPLETPAIERLSTLLGKYGPEGDQLLYRLLHRRDKLARALAQQPPTEQALSELGLRYDLTVPLARVVARHQAKLPRIFSRYQIQPVWRADRPGRGRFREFYQCDVDVVGTASPLADVSVCHAVAETLRRLGFERFDLLLNHRALLGSIVSKAGIPAALEETALVAVDKLDKIGAGGVQKELAERGIESDAAARLLDLVLPTGGTEADDPLARLGRAGLDERGQRGLLELRALLDLAATGPAGDHLRPAPQLARGLGYYTGPIFEISVPDLAGSLGGGGRYDGLIGMFSGKQTPAVGFSLGLERILVVMEERGLFPALAGGPDIVVCGFPDVAPQELLRVAETLRRQGRSVEVFCEPSRKLKQQLRYATSRGAREVAIVGADELARGVVAIKTLETGEQREEAL